MLNLVKSLLPYVPQRFSAVATPQWYLEGILNYGTNGFHKTMTSFATDALSVVSKTMGESMTIV